MHISHSAADKSSIKLIPSRKSCCCWTHFHWLLAELCASVIKICSLFIVFSPCRLVFVMIMCEVKFLSRKREKNLLALSVAMKLSRRRIWACQVSLLSYLTNCTGTTTDYFSVWEQWENIVIFICFTKLWCISSWGNIVFHSSRSEHQDLVIINGFWYSQSFSLRFQSWKNYSPRLDLYFIYQKMADEYISVIWWHTLNLPLNCTLINQNMCHVCRAHPITSFRG